MLVLLQARIALCFRDRMMVAYMTQQLSKRGDQEMVSIGDTAGVHTRWGEALVSKPRNWTQDQERLCKGRN